MFSQSIRRKIVGIALGLVVLMIATSILSMLMANRVGHLLDELTNKYVPAYGDLARAHVRSLEGALALRQMVIAKMQTPPDDAAFAQRMQIYRTKDAQVAEEAEAARKLIGSIIEDTSTPSDNVALALIDGRIEAAVTDVRRLLTEEHRQLISQLEALDFAGSIAQSSGLSPSKNSSTKGLMKSAGLCWPRSAPVLQRLWSISSGQSGSRSLLHRHSRDLGIAVCRLSAPGLAPRPAVAARCARGRGGPDRRSIEVSPCSDWRKCLPGSLRNGVKTGIAQP